MGGLHRERVQSGGHEWCVVGAERGKWWVAGKEYSKSRWVGRGEEDKVQVDTAGLNNQLGPEHTRHISFHQCRCLHCDTGLHH